MTDVCSIGGMLNMSESFKLILTMALRLVLSITTKRDMRGDSALLLPLVIS